MIDVIGMVGETIEIKTESVSLMCREMDRRMMEHKHWSGWSQMSIKELSARLLANLVGILNTRFNGDSEYSGAAHRYIRDQSADIANFAMMIAQNYGKLREAKMEVNNPDLDEIKERISDLQNDQETKDNSDRKIAEESIEENTARLEAAVDKEVLKKALDECFEPEQLERFQYLLTLSKGQQGGLGDTWKFPKNASVEQSERTPGEATPAVPYLSTLERMESIGNMVIEITERLSPVLADPNTIAEVRPDAITPVDTKLERIFLDLDSLLHRIQV